MGKCIWAHSLFGRTPTKSFLPLCPADFCVVFMSFTYGRLFFRVGNFGVRAALRASQHCRSVPEAFVYRWSSSYKYAIADAAASPLDALAGPLPNNDTVVDYDFALELAQHYNTSMVCRGFPVLSVLLLFVFVWRWEPVVH